MLTRVNPPAPDSDAAPETRGGARSDAQLVAGTMHDDVLLVPTHMQSVGRQHLSAACQASHVTAGMCMQSYCAKQRAQ